MAALTANQFAKQFSEGTCDRMVLYAVRKASTGDTIDVSADFLNVEQCVFMGTTVNGVASGSVSSSTTITVPSGLTADAAWLMVWGSANG